MFLTQLETSTLSNQDVSAALLAHTFTNATRERIVRVNVYLKDLAGNGNYSVYATKQLAGTGTAYPSVLTTQAVPSGVTAHWFVSEWLDVGSTDVLKVYVVGLAGDTTTVDIITQVKEMYVATDSSGRVDLVDAPNATAITAFATAVWASATRTLTSLSGLTSSIAQAVWEYATRTITGGGGSAADIWAYATRTLTQAAASVISAVQGSVLTEYRGETWSIAITGLGSLTGYSKIYFAIKAEKSDADSDALVFIEKTAGLTRLNGAVYSTAADGSITIDSEGSGNLTITVKPAATALLTPRGGLHYGIKMVTTGGVVRQLSDGSGKFTIAADIPLAIS